MNEKIVKRIHNLRERMQEEEIDYYMIPTSDYHNSEYVAPFFKVREFFSDFTGSNGTLLVSRDRALLWTDGRYFIQAKKELMDTGIELMKMGEQGVPAIEEYLCQNIASKQVLGFDGKVCNTRYIKNICDKIKEKNNSSNVLLFYKKDLADEIWIDRPALSHESVSVLACDYHGKDYSEKIQMVYSVMKEKNASYFFLSKLDDIMWLFNIRGKDVECNPVALAYAFITMDKSYLFLQPKAVSKAVKEYASSNNIVIEPYEEVFDFLNTFDYAGAVMLNENETSYYAYDVIRNRTTIVNSFNPTELPKAIKNQTEVERMKEAYLLDSAAVCRFIYWLKTSKEQKTELSAAAYLDHLRAKIDNFKGVSFPTISAYGENAAMMHYEASKESNKKIENKGLFLVDSGGQYLGATTDVTRTICMGTVTEEEKECFTLVLKGMLQLMNAVFLYGCTGRNLDILARGPLWSHHIDYKCGTGHGVGCFLNVHEGPQNIGWKYNRNREEAILEEGMTVTDEPGVYIEGKFGIRTENVLLVKKEITNGDGSFMAFEPLTLVPIDLQAVNVSFLEDDDMEHLNQYHEMVYEKIAPLLDKDEKEWLRKVTEQIKR